MIDLGGKAAITDVGTMVFLPSTRPKLTLGDQEYLRSGVIDSIANYPEFPSWLATTGAGSYWRVGNIPAGNWWSSVVYGNNTFVAVTRNVSGINYAATSPDGITWTQRTLPISNISFSSIAFGNGIFVALGEATSGSAGSNVSMTSPNGITWTQRTLPANKSWKSIAFGNGIFVATVWGESSVWTSPDGITWTQRTLPSSSASYVAFGNGIFVATGDFIGTVGLRSADGITWSAFTFPQSAKWAQIAYKSGKFLVAAGNNIYATSTDGIVWRGGTFPVDTGVGVWIVGASDTVFIAAHSNSANTVYISEDAVLWSSIGLPVGIDIRGIIYSGNIKRVVAVGVNGASVYSDNSDGSIGTTNYTPNLYLRVE